MSTHPNRATGARAPRAAAIQQPAPLSQYQADDGDTPYEISAESTWRTWLDDQVSWLTSSVLHAVGLMVLALIPLAAHEPHSVQSVIVDVPPPKDTKDPPLVPNVPVIVDQPNLKSFDTIETLPTLDPPPALTPNVDKHEGEVSQQGVTSNVFEDWARERNRPGAIGPNHSKDVAEGGFGDRGKPRGIFGRPDGFGNRRSHGPFGPAGPTGDTEAAVDAALAWLAAHQLPDGSWSFDHRGGVCNGRCKNHGQFAAAKNAATGLALLTFLGAGETHLEGRYQKTVDAGLRYLLATQKLAGAAGSWHEAVGNSGNYSHAIATLAVCEAYAMAQLLPAPKKPPKSPSEMTEEERRKWKEERERAKQRPAQAIDKQRLAAAAQAGVNYLVEGQHSAGGWRYNNGQAGDTSVVGWVLMALKSGHLSNVKVPVGTVVRTSKFLDSVQEGDYGAIYHYMADKNRPTNALKATTSIGLLCRMYLGWDKNHPGIAEGTAQLARWEPSTVGGTNMYYNYYATQVMHHYGGDPWKKWNLAMREHLVKTQAKDGHERGSWHFTGDHGTTAGGRLYATTLAAMTLEVYYRYLPIYRDRSVEDDLQKP
ncbi:MAG: hypothetical protein DCC68_09035 [Planctomycetota bacterium]|nr:MAG: hypothetical protein DCC68_09035 [Planctomycetota bacterium]